MWRGTLQKRVLISCGIASLDGMPDGAADHGRERASRAMMSPSAGIPCVEVCQGRQPIDDAASKGLSMAGCSEPLLPGTGEGEVVA